MTVHITMSKPDQTDSRSIPMERDVGLALERPALGARGLLAVYECLFASYGPQYWWPAESRLEVIVGAILTQSVAWRNVEQAITNLKSVDALVTPTALAAFPQEKLAALIRPAGYYNAKARKILSFLDYLSRHYDLQLDLFCAQELGKLRKELLSIWGIGPETADAILLYAAEKPIFVVDAYTRRLFSRLGPAPEQSDYHTLQAVFMNELPHQVYLFQEYHALIVRHAILTCRKQRPACGDCPLGATCSFAQLDDSRMPSAAS